MNKLCWNQKVLSKGLATHENAGKVKSASKTTHNIFQSNEKQPATNMTMMSQGQTKGKTNASQSTHLLSWNWDLPVPAKPGSPLFSVPPTPLPFSRCRWDATAGPPPPHSSPPAEPAALPASPSDSPPGSPGPAQRRLWRWKCFRIKVLENKQTLENCNS